MQTGQGNYFKKYSTEIKLYQYLLKLLYFILLFLYLSSSVSPTCHSRSKCFTKVFSCHFNFNEARFVDFSKILIKDFDK